MTIEENSPEPTAGAPTVGVGMVGCGMIGQLAHLANYAAIEECRVVALAELRPELGKCVASKFGIPKVYASHRELLSDPAVDVIIVVTRRHATGPIVLDALNAGKHVLSKKPMAHSVTQAERLVSAANESQKHYAVGFMKRHDAGIQEAKRLLDRLVNDGKLGSITRVHAYCFAGDTGCAKDGFVMTDEPRPDGIELWPTGPEWLPNRFHDDYDAFLNVHIHIVNALRYLLGPTPAVTAVEFRRPQEYLAHLDFETFTGVLELGEVRSKGWNEGVEIWFEGVRLEIAFPPPLRAGLTATVALYRTPEATDPEITAIEPSWAFERQARAFIDDIRKQRRPITSGDDSIEDLRVAEAIWRLHVAA